MISARCVRLNRADSRLLSCAIGFITAATFAPLATAQSSEPSADSEARYRERRQQADEVEAARARREWQELEARADTTREILTRLQTKTESLNARMKAALTNEEGKRLAVDPVSFMTFQRIQEEPAVTTDEVGVRLKAIESIKTTITEHLNEPNVGYLPDLARRDEIVQLRGWTDDRLTRVSEQEAWLSAALEKAPKDLDLSHAKPLEDVIHAYRARIPELLGMATLIGNQKAKEQAQPLLIEAAKTAELNRLLAERDKLLRKAQAEIETLKLEMKLQLEQREAADRQHEQDVETKINDLKAQLERSKKMADAARQKKNVEADLAAKKTTDETEKLILRDRCKAPEVQARLAPILTKGYWQPGKGMTAENAAMSLSKLRQYGALEPNETGLQKLLDCGGKGRGSNKYLDKVRPQWGYNPRLLKNDPEAIEEIKRAQKDLIELGDTMVELNMLSP